MQALRETTNNPTCSAPRAPPRQGQRGSGRLWLALRRRRWQRCERVGLVRVDRPRAAVFVLEVRQVTRVLTPVELLGSGVRWENVRVLNSVGMFFPVPGE